MGYSASYAVLVAGVVTDRRPGHSTIPVRTFPPEKRLLSDAVPERYCAGAIRGDPPEKKSLILSTPLVPGGRQQPQVVLCSGEGGYKGNVQSSGLYAPLGWSAGRSLPECTAPDTTWRVCRSQFSGRWAPRPKGR